jgi:hypothetical protein
MRTLLVKRPLFRVFLLSMLLLLSVGLYGFLSSVALPNDIYVLPFLFLWMGAFLPYLAACALVLLTPVEPTQRRWQLLEVGIILGGALLFRAMLIPQVPWLSRDSWRYLWDARVFLHGYSPYVYPPDSPVLQPLRDSLIYGHSGFRDVPTLYPPVAQYVYILSYLIAPSNLFFLKTLFVLMDMASCCILVILLLRRGLDPRRVILYAWCPLPIVEFAIEGHVDALTVMLVALVLLVATHPHAEQRNMRILLGFLIALATLSKIYPILLLIAVIRRRDWALLVTCFATIFLAYLPFLILGHGQVFGFFSNYATEQRQNAGIIPSIVHWVTYKVLHVSDTITLGAEYGVDLLVVLPVLAFLFIARLRERISIEVASFVLIGLILAVSSHIFPWYTPALLFFVPLLLGPLWTRHAGVVELRSGTIAIIAVWYFVCVTLTAYFFRNVLDWTLYYQYVYWVVTILLGVAGGYTLYTMRKDDTFIMKHVHWRKRQT